MIEVTEHPIDSRDIYERISHEGSGSVVVHFGVVKPVVSGRATRGIRFSARPGLKDEVRSIESRLRKRWTLTDVLLVRRVGELSIGDIILAAAVSAPERGPAFEACREAVESFKKLERMQKEELFE
ncbi:MAG: molybdenum cofactor biosynthesis protein MoaE [Candidatus Abyssubacteria bacterium]